MDEQTLLERLIAGRVNAVLDEVLTILETDDGKSFEEKKEKIDQLLSAKIEKPEASRDKGSVPNVTDTFWQQGEITVAEGLILRRVKETDREHYLALEQYYFVAKSMLEDETFRDKVWRNHIDDKTLLLVVEQNSEYIGYCGIKDTTQEHWEIMIELFPQWTNRGIGYSTIHAMLDALKRRLGVTSYRVRIEPSNTASQRLFEKLGATPNGISEFLLHGAEELEKYEEVNLSSVTEQLSAVAQRFGVAPRKLLSHVLEYRLEWQTD